MTAALAEGPPGNQPLRSLQHWGVATLLDLVRQLGVVPSLGG